MQPTLKRRRVEDTDQGSSNLTKPAPFVYTPLQDAERIRVLELHSATSRNAALFVSLRTQDLGGKNPLTVSVEHGAGVDTAYEALSYAWGSTEQPCEVNIDGNTLPIGRNLHQALLQFRRHGSSRRLWVDAICINQDDNDERSSQVAKMVRIYGNATRTIAWLGLDSGSNDGAVCSSFFRWLVSDQACTKHGEEFNSIQEAMLHYNEKQIEAAMTTRTLMEFGSRAYFGRSWILQEVGVASEVQFWCGSTEITGRLLGKAALSIKALGPPYELRAPIMRLASMNVPSLHPEVRTNLLHPDTEFGGSIRLINMLDDFCDFVCCDARDRIAALKWVAPAFAEYKIDYSSTVEEVYIRIAVELARHLKHDIFWLLGAAVRRIRSLDPLDLLLPSWVPDWRTAPRLSWPSIDVGECTTCSGCARVTHIWAFDHEARASSNRHAGLELVLSNVQASAPFFEHRVPAMLADGDYVLGTAQLARSNDNGLGALILRRHHAFEGAWRLAGGFTYHGFRSWGWQPTKTFTSTFLLM